MKRIKVYLVLLSCLMLSCSHEAPNKFATIVINGKDTVSIEYYRQLSIKSNDEKLIDENDNILANKVQSFNIISINDTNRAVRHN